MLHFSKTKLAVIYIIIIFLTIFSLLNISNNKENFFLSKNINLGLDLQGGSYLLLEVDSKPMIEQKLQQKLLELRKSLKKEKIKFKNLFLKNKKIFFTINNQDIDKFKIFFTDKENNINTYYPQYRSDEMLYDILNNVIQIEFSKFGIIEIKNSTLNQSLEIVRRRIDEVGTKDPTIIRRGNDRILIELPGLTEPNRIKKLLGKTANLTFRLVSVSEDAFGSEKLFFENSTDKLNISKRVILSGDNLINAKPTFNSQNNEAVVSFTFDRVGAKKFGRVTNDNIGKKLGIILDNKIISAPTIQEAITGGSGQITGNFTFQTATDLALLLRSGALPAPLKIVEERTVGPDLGQDSINAGIIALLIGFFLVIVFMFFKYKIFGLIANITLLINLFLLIGVLTLFGATLTLPGIAGIILTVGMAVDANVLIFERIKEECKNEKNNIIAFDSGYVRSKTAIIDANITTLLAALILFLMGSGPIKGFSVTLGVGIFTTLFSVYFIARLLTSIYVIKNKEKVNLI